MARNLAKLLLVGVLLASGVLLPGCAGETQAPLEPPRQAVSLDELPEFSGDPFVEVNGNVPSFSEAERDLAALEAYAPLDGLGRCGTAFALIGPETMPTEERGSIGSVKPSGWHLENANERNLVTGTRFMNVRGMVPLEDRVASYVDRTGNHVLYRATPVFEGDDLVARGVHIEAESVEDGGSGVSFNVFAYNAQPGVEIDYATGESRLDGSLESQGAFDASQYAYVLNVKTKRFHKPDCPSVEDMKAANREGFDGSREEAEARGYVPCGRCNP